MNSPRARQAAGLGLVLLIAIVAAYFLMPRPDVGVEMRPKVAQAPKAPPPAPLMPSATPSEPAGEAELVIIEEDDPNLPPPTEKCDMIAGWAQAGTPHYTLLDNIRDQAMLFTEEDLACLTAARDVPPIVLRFAEMYQRKGQPNGR